MAGKLNICIVVVVVLAVVLLYTFKSKPDHFARSSKFDKEKKMIFVSPTGEFELKHVSDIDSAINDETLQVAVRLSKLMRDYQPLRLMHEYQPRGDYQPKGDYQPRGDYQPAGDYIRRNTNYAIKMGPGNAAPANQNRYMKGSDDSWRVSFDTGNPGPKWSFV